jgi:hypothetical protein
MYLCYGWCAWSRKCYADYLKLWSVGTLCIQKVLESPLVGPELFIISGGLSTDWAAAILLLMPGPCQPLFYSCRRHFMCDLKTSVPLHMPLPFIRLTRFIRVTVRIKPLFFFFLIYFKDRMILCHVCLLYSVVDFSLDRELVISTVWWHESCSEGLTICVWVCVQGFQKELAAGSYRDQCFKKYWAHVPREYVVDSNTWVCVCVWERGGREKERGAMYSFPDVVHAWPREWHY